jgi:NTP pyrophosphatase (non-canonical NTP hydrolase)
MFGAFRKCIYVKEGNTMTDDQTTLAQIKAVIRAFRVKRGWTKEDPKDLALSITLESAELLEHFQWLKGSDAQNNPKIKQAISEEMSDVLWWLLNLGQVLISMLLLL